MDQCEEVFSLCADRAEREAFLDTLVAHVASAPLILSFRADRLADLSTYPDFARTVEQSLYLLAGMTETDLRAAIEQPARMASLAVEPGLVDLLVNEVAHQPGAMPLLSHALVETWERREGRTLAVAGYNASGGIRGAVAQSAEEIYESIPPGRRVVLCDLMLRLVTSGPEGEPVRSRLPRRLVVTGPEDDAMIDLLVESRLVTSDTGVVELAHESLARAWPRLRGWLEDNLENQRILHHLAVAADSWNGLGRPDSELYRGVRLAKALDWRQETKPTLTAVERDFLDAGRRLSETELRAAENQARHQVRVNRRLRAALATGAVLLVGALVAGSVAVSQANHAQQAATSELARKVGARALLTEDISHSVLLAAQGVRLDDSAETRANLVAAMNKHPNLIRSIPAAGGRTENVEISADGSRIVAGGIDATFHLYDSATGRVLASHHFGAVPGGEQAFTTPRFSPRDRLVAAIAGTAEGKSIDPRWPLRLLDGDTLDPVTPQLAIPSMDNLRFSSLAFSADGRYLAASGQTTQASSPSFNDAAFALVWDLRAAGIAPRKVQLPSAMQGIVLSPDGRTIYCAWPLSAYDVATGKQKWQRADLLGGFTGIDISTRGDLLALQRYEANLTDSTSIDLVNAQTGRTVKVLPSPVDSPSSLTFSPDGGQLATVVASGEVTVWDVAKGIPRVHIKTSEVSWAADFSPDGQTLYTAGDAGILRVYDLAGAKQYLHRAHTAPLRRYLQLSPPTTARRPPTCGRTAQVPG